MVVNIMFNHTFYFERVMQYLKNITYYDDMEDNILGPFIKKYGWMKGDDSKTIIYRSFDIDEDQLMQQDQLPLYLEIGCGYIDEQFKQYLKTKGYHFVDHNDSIIAFKSFTTVPNIMHYVNIVSKKI